MQYDIQDFSTAMYCSRLSLEITQKLLLFQSIGEEMAESRWYDHIRWGLYYLQWLLVNFYPSVQNLVLINKSSGLGFFYLKERSLPLSRIKLLMQSQLQVSSRPVMWQVRHLWLGFSVVAWLYINLSRNSSLSLSFWCQRHLYSLRPCIDAAVIFF